MLVFRTNNSLTFTQFYMQATKIYSHNRTREEGEKKVQIMQPPVGQRLLLHEVSRSHTATHHSRQHTSGRVISPSQRPLPDNKQQSQQTGIPIGFEPTISAGERPQTYALRGRPRDHWDWHKVCSRNRKNKIIQGTDFSQSDRKCTFVERMFMQKTKMFIVEKLPKIHLMIRLLEPQ